MSSAYSLVVVTWRSRADLARLLDSMLAHLPHPHELIVIDNASDDEPERELARWTGPTGFERLDRNRGFGAAANRGVELAAGEAVILLNPDLELLDEGLERLGAAALEQRALVGPRLLESGGTAQPSASGPVVGPWPWLGAVVPGFLQPAPMLARTEPWRLQHRTEVAWLTGACIAAPREALIELGPFDPEIELMSEDLDLCLRAEARDVPRLFAPDLCRLVHHGSRSLRQRFPDAGLELAARNRRTVIARAYGGRRERRAWRAQLLRLRLRSAAKRPLGRDRDRELAELAACGKARTEADPGPSGGVKAKRALRRLLGRAVAALPASPRRRARAAALRFDNRSAERALAREIAGGETGSAPANGIPVPPPLLRVRVTGFRSGREEWLSSGALDAELIRELLERNGHELAAMDAVLDFGCGCGRVARHWTDPDGPRIHGVDPSRSLIRWCRRNLPSMRAERSGPLPPLPHPDGSFDLVYAISVFTHLPEDAGSAWLRELARVLKPGGLLLFTVHGQRFLDGLSERDRARFHSGELVVTESPQLAGTNRFGAFHPPEYVRERLLPGAGLELIDAVNEDAGEGRGLSVMAIQDNYLARKPAG